MSANMSLRFLPCILLTTLFLAEPISAGVLVTVAPYRELVQEIVGEKVPVEVLVPPGVSGHSFEPSPKKTLQASKSLIWFRTGEPFETQAIASFTSHNPKMRIVDLRQGLTLMPGCCHHKDHADTHIWLSPRLLTEQIKTITRALSELFPEEKAAIEGKGALVIARLTQLDHTIKEIWSQSEIKTILVTHPAYGYYCRDYGITQISLEVEGKDPTPSQVQKLFKAIRAKGIKRLFSQPEYGGKGAQVVAESLKLQMITLDIFAPDLEQNLLQITKTLAKVASE